MEESVKEMSKKESLVSFEAMSKLASEFGINGDEILESVRLLNDLGSLQYFERNGLKDKVIINPQVTTPFLFQ